MVVNFWAIQETNIENVDFISVCSFGGNLPFSHAFSSSHGASGGIILIWDLNHFVHNRVIISDLYVAVEGVRSVSGLDVLCHTPKTKVEIFPGWTPR
uniref:Uncharacterized protein n=1 Tax=Lactuca sativa TaxID=4236 RepID=A0A9R1UY56_LACSA|nr:hypothetical protein LSAT_V11C700368870 [Lactuca sativa]